MREAEKLGVADQRAALEPQVARNHRFHLIEEQLLRDATERGERFLKTIHERRHILARIEAAPQHPRVAKHHEQGVAHAPVKSKSCEVDLRLSAGGRLEADDRLRRWQRPHPTHVGFQLRVAARVPGCAVSSRSCTDDSSGYAVSRASIIGL